LAFFLIILRAASLGEPVFHGTGSSRGQMRERGKK